MSPAETAQAILWSCRAALTAEAVLGLTESNPHKTTDSNTVLNQVDISGICQYSLRTGFDKKMRDGKFTAKRNACFVKFLTVPAGKRREVYARDDSIASYLQ